jgi:hypothetical protein
MCSRLVSALQPLGGVGLGACHAIRVTSPGLAQVFGPLDLEGRFSHSPRSMLVGRGIMVGWVDS